MSKEVMLDLETLGSTNNAAIVQIGMCYFDRYTGEIGDTFLQNIDIETCLSVGMEVDASTIYWWLSQEKDAQNSLLSNKTSIVLALMSVNTFLNKAKTIWLHTTFDYVILKNAFNKTKLKPNFHYRSARDLRTLVDLADIKCDKQKRTGIHHNALDDCIFQVQYAVKCFNALKR